MEEKKSHGLFVVFKPLMSAQQSSINRSITLMGNHLISRRTTKDTSTRTPVEWRVVTFFHSRLSSQQRSAVNGL